MGKLSSLLARSITGVIYVAIIVGAIVSNSVVFIGLVFAVMAGLGCYEYQNIVGANKRDFIMKILHSVMAALAMYVTFVALTEDITSPKFIIALTPYMAYYLFYTLGEIFRTGRQPIDEVAHAFFSHLYIGVPLGLLLSLSLGMYQYASTDLGSLPFPRTFWILPIFVFVWLNDTGAYLIGSLIGRHKLNERVSPKKTVEGTIGGIIVAILGGLVFHFIFPTISTWYHWTILATLVALFATLGDLFESLLKRTYGVKDSGNILPGHGGILDRIDSILFATIPAYIYVALFIYV